MNPFEAKKYGKQGPEAKIQEKIVEVLKSADFFVQVMIGNAYQFGIPDLFAAHRSYGQKWIEVKNPAQYSFTDRQQQKFPLMHAAGVGIWILFSAEPEEILKLTKPCNWLSIYSKWLAGVK